MTERSAPSHAKAVAPPHPADTRIAELLALLSDPRPAVRGGWAAVIAKPAVRDRG